MFSDYFSTLHSIEHFVANFIAKLNIGVTISFNSFVDHTPYITFQHLSNKSESSNELGNCEQYEHRSGCDGALGTSDKDSSDQRVLAGAFPEHQLWCPDLHRNAYHS